jgi:hypothetical protein
MAGVHPVHDIPRIHPQDRVSGPLGRIPVLRWSELDWRNAACTIVCPDCCSIASMYYSPRTHNISRDIPRERRQTRMGYVLSPLAPIALDLLLSRLCSRQQTMTDIGSARTTPQTKLLDHRSFMNPRTFYAHRPLVPSSNRASWTSPPCSGRVRRLDCRQTQPPLPI